MKLKKNGLILLFLFLISILVVSCSEERSDDSSLGGLLQDATDKIISIGKLDFLGDDADALIGFMRVLIGILVFAVLFGVGGHLLPSKNIATVIAGILSIMSIIFIPGELLAVIGATYGVVVSFILIGIPILIGGFILYKLPSSNRPLILLKMVIIALLIWILFAVKTHAINLAGM